MMMKKWIINPTQIVLRRPGLEMWEPLICACEILKLSGVSRTCLIPFSSLSRETFDFTSCRCCCFSAASSTPIMWVIEMLSISVPDGGLAVELADEYFMRRYVRGRKLSWMNELIATGATWHDMKARPLVRKVFWFIRSEFAAKRFCYVRPARNKRAKL